MAEHKPSSIKPDLTVLGKIIGGGLLVGAYGGRKEIMDLIAPVGPVYQAGTLSGNPLAVSAGLATLKQLRGKGVYKQLEQRSVTLAKGIGEAAKRAGVPVTQTRVGSMLTTFFTPGPVVDWSTAKQSDTKRYGQFFHHMLEQGIYLAPSQFEAVWRAITITASYVWAHLRPSPVEENFEQWVVNRFGRQLYEIFFKTYTEKVWGIPCTEIRAEWAAQRIQGLSLAKAILNAAQLQRRSATIKTLINEFQYPRLGPGQMWETAAEKIRALPVARC